MVRDMGLPSREFTYSHQKGSSENHRHKMPFLEGYVSSLEGIYQSPINGLIKGLSTYIYILDIWISSWGLPKKIHGTSPEVVWFRTCQTANERIPNTNFHWDTSLKLNIWNLESSKKWRGKWSEPSTCVGGFNNLILHGVPLNIQMPSNTSTSCELVIQVLSQELFGCRCRFGSLTG